MQVLDANPDEVDDVDNSGTEEVDGSDYDLDDDFINDGTESNSEYDSEVELSI